MRLLLPLLLAGCATTELVWVKHGATQQEFHADAGQCRAQAFGVSGAMFNQTQVAIVYASCMQGKGWYTQERPLGAAGGMPETNPNYTILKQP